jgi:oxygen-independent coproporphyrinogen-3 oxidase
MFRFSVSPPLSLYVHIPWCVRKCPYCDFNSHESKGAIPEQDYVTALLADLEQELVRVQDREVQSIFIGGGTPSLFAPRSIAYLLTEIGNRLNLAPELEITMEVNPGTMERGKFAEFRAAGVNRLSMGIQSFHPELLQRIGRSHGREEALKAAETARSAGFENFNLDLMYGLPGQRLDQALGDLRLAMEFEPAHLSWYQLTIEPNTRFHHQPPQLPEDDVIADMQEQGQGFLKQGGYQQYEVSAYARDGRQCRHNLNYWRFGDYLGVGAGAHGKYTDVTRQRIHRTWKSRHPKDYLTNAGESTSFSGYRALESHDAVLEFMLNALRLTEGFSSGLFEQTTGLPFRTVTGQLATAQQLGMIELLGLEDPIPGAASVHVRPTRFGHRFLNDLVALFLPENSSHDAGCTG